MINAIVETTSKYTRLFTPTRPTFLRSPAPEIPSTTVRNTIGPMSILTRLMKPSATGLSPTAGPGATIPKTLPATMATRIQK